MDAASWDQRYAEIELVWSTAPNRFVVDQVTALIAKRSGDITNARALDLAGGEGRNALWLAEQGFDTELVEFSAVALEKAQTIAQKRGVALVTTLADVTKKPALKPADLVLVCYLQLANEPLTQALRHAATLVAPGGTLLIVAHERDNLEHGYGGPLDPMRLPTVTDVLVAIDHEGLTIEHAGQVRRLVETEDGPREAIDLLVRATRAN